MMFPDCNGLNIGNQGKSNNNPFLSFSINACSHVIIRYTQIHLLKSQLNSNVRSWIYFNQKCCLQPECGRLQYLDIEMKAPRIVDAFPESAIG